MSLIKREGQKESNSNDTFYQSNFLHSMGNNFATNQPTNDETSHMLGNGHSKDSHFHEVISDEEVLDYLDKDTTDYVNNYTRIKEEELEESLKESTALNRSIGTKKYSKNSSTYKTEGSGKNYVNRERNSVNKENRAISHTSKSHSATSGNKNNTEERFISPSDKHGPESDRGKELLTITVEIGNGQRENIIIFENDDAQNVSDTFWNKHNINDELKEIFTNQIAENIIQVKEEIALEQAEGKFASAPHIDNYRNISPPSIEQPAFSDMK